MLTSSHRYPLEFGHESVGGVEKKPFWELISQWAEYQRLHPELYGQIEHELEWVDVSHFKQIGIWLTPEKRWLHEMVRFLNSEEENGVPLPAAANGFKPKTYVIPFRDSLPGDVVHYDGIPEDVCFLRVYMPWPYPKYSLRDEHLSAQAFYSDQLAVSPHARKQKLRMILYRQIDILYRRIGLPS
jgi:hypothetical protein